MSTKLSYAAALVLSAGLINPAQSNTLNDLPVLSLPDVVRSEQALNAVGNRLPVWADTYDMTVADFAKTLREDEHAFLDARGRLFFTEPDADQMPTANADMISTAQYPLSQTFLLESRPSSAVTIYLDFDGHTLVNTAWNATTGLSSIAAQPWSTDSDRTTFSSTELAGIQAIWRRVAEDFAPFDVNVTTRFPGEDALIRNTTSDPYYGTRVLVTPNTFYNCSCGGVAYVGTFDYTGSGYYQPALVFNGSVLGVAEAASHEAGHNLGLSHDGTSTVGYYQGHGSGETGWAPIMGVGYYKALVQWSKGEYADANQKQDDYAVMNSNMLYFASDDHGGQIADATAVATTSDGVVTTFSVDGVIGSPSDRDAFTLTAGAGTLSISAIPAANSPNLDIALTVLDASGNVVLGSNDEAVLASAAQAEVAAGQYTVVVDGVGKGDPLGIGYSDYGSLGSYRLSAEFPDSVVLTAPTAVITSDYTPGYAPLAVGFDGSQSINAVSWSWDFGDGASASGSGTSHTYTAPGEYTVALTVASDDGLTDRSELLIDVINQAPFASGSLDTTAGVLPLAVNVSDNGSYDPDGVISSYLWNFGDGSTGTGSNASHSYSSAGDFVVTLTVKDDLGAEATATVGTVAVTAPAFVDSVAEGELSIAGTVSGSFDLTHTLDGNAQVITESETGGKPSRRYSYAEHEWQFSLPAGESVIEIAGTAGSSTDGDQFSAQWTDGGQWHAIGTFDSAGSLLISAPFTHAAQTVTVSVRDTDRSAGNRSLDSVSVDAIVITTDTTVDGGTGSGGGGDTSEGFTLTLTDSFKVKGANQVVLAWDGAGNQFTVQRNGAVVGSTSDSSYTDADLGKGGMNLEYRVCNESNVCSNTLTVVF